MDRTQGGRLSIAVKLYGLFGGTALLLVGAVALTAARGADPGVYALVVAALIAGGVGSTVTIRSIRRGVADVLDRLQMLQDHCTTDLRTGLEAMAAGDLTFTVTPVTPLIDRLTNDEIGDVARAVNAIRMRIVASVEAFNSTTAQLRDVVGELGGAAGSLGAASEQMATTSVETGRAVDEIAQAVIDVAEGAERQVRVVESAKESTAETAAVAGRTRAVASEGVRAATKASEAMEGVRASSAEVTGAIRDLAEKSHEIGGIVETITGIAGQTNLLALNAAIEAARAGEQGKGFAVVAEEVRKLAEESQQAAASIAALVEQIRAETQHAVDVVEAGAKRSEEGVGIVEEARAAFVEIGSAVEDVSSRIAGIVDSMNEVAAVAEQSSATTEEVSASTQQTSASTQQVSASAQDLARTAEQLSALVGRFRLG
jgi:methyl-accepting chemotaxis protein